MSYLYMDLMALSTLILQQTPYHRQLLLDVKVLWVKYNIQIVPCFVIDTAYYIDRRTSHVNLRWLYYVLHALKLERFRNSVLPGLNRMDTEGQYVPLITVEEQRQIANFLDRKTEQIDELIRIKERRIELLQEQRTALINQAVTKGLDPNVEMKPSAVEWIGEIPRHWEVRRNKRIFHERDDRSATGKEELLTVSHITGVSPKSRKEECWYVFSRNSGRI